MREKEGCVNAVFDITKPAVALAKSNNNNETSYFNPTYQDVLLCLSATSRYHYVLSPWTLEIR